MMQHVTSQTGIAFKEIGSGDPVVFIHGFCGSHAYWKSIEHLLESHMKAYYIDLPGHGASKEMPYASLEDYVELLRKWKEEMGIKKMTLIGHSLGGYLTLAYADKYPQDLSGYSLIHSTAFPDSDEGKEGREKGIQTIESQGIEKFIDGLIPKLFDGNFKKQHPETIEEAKAIGFQTEPKQAIRFLKAMRDRKDRRKMLTDSTIPHLLVAGETDEVVPSYKTFIGGSTAATEKLLTETAHMSMYEQPEELSKVIVQWLTSVKQVSI
ncbi:alpha/beta hydrolase [Chryseomicrobium sp. FSL W7-1435]|uniref:alpha/beta fold hydrolase n=1 Tax=Chryseomicrobium sp. FSL W7-1435 TaxID=2921704 RepID=UPI003159A040